MDILAHPAGLTTKGPSTSTTTTYNHLLPPSKAPRAAPYPSQGMGSYRLHKGPSICRLDLHREQIHRRIPLQPPSIEKALSQSPEETVWGLQSLLYPLVWTSRYSSTLRFRNKKKTHLPGLSSGEPLEDFPPIPNSAIITAPAQATGTEEQEQEGSATLPAREESAQEGTVQEQMGPATPPTGNFPNVILRPNTPF